jgi:ribosomal protein S18 acetylase RimI-like enzyme
MADFYYSRLPRQGLIFGAVAYVAEQPAGFVAATVNAAGFMRTALLRNWIRLPRLLGMAVLRDPRRLRTLACVSRLVRRGTSGPAEPVSGEILSLGVLPPYREPHFVRESGLRISTDLVDYAVQRLCDAGVSFIRALVAASNTPAKLLYASLGWAPSPQADTGWPHRVVEFLWHR